MAIHALESGGKDPFFGRRDKKFKAIELHDHAAIDKALRQCFVLAGLAEASDVRLNRFAEAGNAEIPFAGQAVAPTAGFHFGIECLSEYADDIFTASG